MADEKPKPPPTVKETMDRLIDNSPARQKDLDLLIAALQVDHLEALKGMSASLANAFKFLRQRISGVPMDDTAALIDALAHGFNTLQDSYASAAVELDKQLIDAMAELEKEKQK